MDDTPNCEPEPDGSYHEWTACQVYGHQFRDWNDEPLNQCRDCGEQQED